MLPEQANHTEHNETFIKAYTLSPQYRYNLRSNFKHTDILRNLLISNT